MRGVSATALSFQLLFQLVEEAPIGALGDDFLWARLDHARFVEAESVEPYRGLVVVLPPLGVRDLPHGLECVVVTRGVPLADNEPRGPLRRYGAEVVGLHESADHALC